MFIKANSINNLGVARYINAVENIFIGLNYDVLNPKHISIPHSQAIIGWLFEPKIIAEFGLHQTKEEIDYVLNEIEIEGIQLPYTNRNIYNDYTKIRFLKIDEIDGEINCNPTDFLMVNYKHIAQINPALYAQMFVELQYPTDIEIYKLNLSLFAGIAIDDQNLDLISVWNDFLNL